MKFIVSNNIFVIWSLKLPICENHSDVKIVMATVMKSTYIPLVYWKYNLSPKLLCRQNYFSAKTINHRIIVVMTTVMKFIYITERILKIQIN